MYVESKRRFCHGFVLTEAELRRFVSTFHDQFEKIEERPGFITTFLMKFRNGVVAKTQSIDEVLSQENSGSTQLLRVEIDVHAELPESNEAKIHVEFVNTDLDDEPGYTSIRYEIVSPSRDWVFLTSNLLDERIGKVYRFAPNQLSMRRGASRPLYVLLMPLLVMLIALPVGFLLDSKIGQNYAQQLEKAVSDGIVTNALEGLVFIEKAKFESKRFVAPEFYGPIVYILAFFVIISGVFWFFYKYYPIYNFCWGDYADEFKKKEGIRKFVLVVVIIGIVVSFIGGILANRI